MVSLSNSEASAMLEFGRYSYDYEGQSQICFCGLKAPRIMSWSEKNPGRRFFGCPIYDPITRKRQCKYFVWYDHDFSFRAKEVILWLYNNKRELENDLDDASDKIRALRDVVKHPEENEEKHIEALEKKVNDLQMMMTLKMAYVAKLEKWKKCGKFCLVLTAFLALVLAFFLFRTWVNGADRKRDLKSIRD